MCINGKINETSRILVFLEWAIALLAQLPVVKTEDF